MAGQVTILKKDGVYSPKLSKGQIREIEKSVSDAEKEIRKRAEGEPKDFVLGSCRRKSAQNNIAKPDIFGD